MNARETKFQALFGENASAFPTNNYFFQTCSSDQNINPIVTFNFDKQVLFKMRAYRM